MSGIDLFLESPSPMSGPIPPDFICKTDPALVPRNLGVLDGRLIICPARSVIGHVLGDPTIKSGTVVLLTPTYAEEIAQHAAAKGIEFLNHSHDDGKPVTGELYNFIKMVSERMTQYVLGDEPDSRMIFPWSESFSCHQYCLPIYDYQSSEQSNRAFGGKWMGKSLC